MLFVIIPAIVFFAVFLGIGISEGEWGYGFLFGLLAGAVAILIVLLASMCFVGAPAGVIDTETHEIHALVDNMQFEGKVSGSVFLVQSRVDEELKYNYMYNVEGKGFGFKSAKATSCYLNYLEDPSDAPYVKILHYDWKSPILRWCFGESWLTTTEYMFYLPEGANIIDDFTIDFE